MILKNLTNTPQTAPDQIIALRDGVYATDLLVTAVAHLDFFTWLRDNPGTIDSIAQHFDIALRPTDVMLTYFKSLNLVEEKLKIFNTTLKANEHLCSDSEWSLTPYITTQAERPIVEKMLQVLKSDEPQSWGSSSDEMDWEQAMLKDEFAAMFTLGMDSRGAYFAPGLARSFDFSNYSSLIDIAGASGIYAACIKAQHPNIKAALLEKPPVDKVAKKSLQQRGIENEIEVLAGDMFSDPIPSGYDIHLYSHAFHDWNLEQNRILVKNSFQSLHKGGIIQIHDAHLNREKTGPLSVAEYSVLLMFSTPGKCYSVSELEALLLEEGFINVQYKETIGNRSVVSGEKP